MKDNKLRIKINRPIKEVFTFVITPPHTTLWIDSIIKEKINSSRIKVGTIYTLQNKKKESFEVIVTAYKKNEYIEWTSQDGRYHCKYIITAIDDSTSEFEYYEWVDEGEIDNPFEQTTLEKLKRVIEAS